MVDLRTISFPIYTHLSDLSLHRKTNKDILTTDTKYRLNYAWIQKTRIHKEIQNISTMKTKIKVLLKYLLYS